MLFLLLGAPAQQGVYAERILYVNQNPYRRIDRGYLFHRENCLEKGSGGSAILYRDLDAHQAKIEKLRQKIRREMLLLVHLRDKRAYALLRKLANGIAEEHLIFAQTGEWSGIGELFGIHIRHLLIPRARIQL